MASAAYQTTTSAALEPTSALLEGRTPREQTSASLKGPMPLEGLSASLEGSAPLGRISASLEAHPRPTFPHLLLPKGALISPSRHADSLTLPGNLASALCGQAATVPPFRALCKCCTLIM
jgi:hypothetical protein